MFSADGFIASKGLISFRLLVIQPLRRAPQQPLQLHEIDQHPGFVQFRTAQPSPALCSYGRAGFRTCRDNCAGRGRPRRCAPRKLQTSKNLSTSDNLRCKPVIRQGIEKDLTVTLFRNSIIQQREHAAIAGGSDQPPESLLQRDGRLRDLIVVERIAARLAHRVRSAPPPPDRWAPRTAAGR